MGGLRLGVVSETPRYVLTRSQARWWVWTSRRLVQLAIPSIVLVTVIILAIVALRSFSSGDSILVSPGLSTLAPKLSGPLAIKGPLIAGKSEWLKPGWEYIYSIPEEQKPLCINITSGRVHLVRSRPNPADLGFHAGPTNLWGGFYKLFPVDVKGRPARDEPIWIKVQVGGTYLSRQDKPISPESPEKL